MNKENIKHLIAGPCSAETEKQVLDTAKAVSAIKEVSLFRAGVWKPRTNPNSFSGIGDVGLKWLNRVQQEYNLKVITEVATPYHVEKCLSHNIDAIWIGARTTVNPFYVQEIANSLKGVDIPVYVKNPITPDFPLWSGAIERFNAVGVNDVTAIHRGFHTYKNTSKYRNAPIWEIPLKLQKEYPNIDVICDPSHIAGNSKFIQEVSQKAMLNNMKGLMIEAHLSPKDALSDKDQQIKPDELKEIINSINNLKYKLDYKSLVLKQELNSLDEDILYLLVKRSQLVKKKMTLNDDKSDALYNFDERKAFIKEFNERTKDLSLSDAFISKIMHILLNEA